MAFRRPDPEFILILVRKFRILPQWVRNLPTPLPVTPPPCSELAKLRAYVVFVMDARNRKPILPSASLDLYGLALRRRCCARRLYYSERCGGVEVFLECAGQFSKIAALFLRSVAPPTTYWNRSRARKEEARLRIRYSDCFSLSLRHTLNQCRKNVIDLAHAV